MFTLLKKMLLMHNEIKQVVTVLLSSCTVCAESLETV